MLGQPLPERLEVDVETPADAQDAAVEPVGLPVEDQPAQAAFGEQVRVPVSTDLARRITVRLSPEVYTRLESVAGQTQRTVSDVVRHAVEGLAVRPLQQRRENDAVIHQLIRLGNNLNQQTRLLHLLRHRGHLPDPEVLLATLREVQGAVQSLSHRLRTRDP